MVNVSVSRYANLYLAGYFGMLLTDDLKIWAAPG